MANVYVASSWRNFIQPDVVTILRQAGHDVYDFKNPRAGDVGFHWSEIDPEWKSWTPDQYIEGLSHPIAQAGFKSDFDAMKWADACVLVLPCGRSAHLEAGWFAGAGRPVYVLQIQSEEPELMNLLATGVFSGMSGVVAALKEKFGDS